MADQSVPSDSKFSLVAVYGKHKAMSVLGMASSTEELNDLYKAKHADSEVPVFVVESGEFFPVSGVEGYLKAYADAPSDPSGHSRAFAKGFLKALAESVDKAETDKDRELRELHKSYDDEEVRRDLGAKMDDLSKMSGFKESAAPEGAWYYLVAILEDGERCAAKVLGRSRSKTELHEVAVQHGSSDAYTPYSTLVTVGEGDVFRCAALGDTILKSTCPKVYDKEVINRIMNPPKVDLSSQTG
jgi:hypothetical protein